MKEPVTIELFPCAGGMAEGFRRAGVTFDLAVDKDPNAVKSYTLNLGHEPVRMDVHDLLRLVRLGGWSTPVDLLVADPPCTPWSTAGKRLGLHDERDCMVVTVELIRLLRPRIYLIGNVPGLETEPNIRVVQETIGSLTKDGYCTADFAKLDAANYGVPQNRIRPFWFGHLEGPCLKWPAPTHAKPGGTLPLFDEMRLTPWVTCRQALSHLPPEEIGRPVKLRRRRGKRAGKKPRGSAIDEPAHVVTTRAQSGDGSIVYDPKHQPSRADEPARTLGAKMRSQGEVLELEAPGPDANKRKRGAPTWDNHPNSRLDEPAKVVRTNGGRNSQAGSVLIVDDEDDDPNAPLRQGFVVPTSPDRVARAGMGGLAVGPEPPREPHRRTGAHDHHQRRPHRREDRRRMGVDAESAPREDKHPVSRPDEPAKTVPASRPHNGGGAIEWPWNRPGGPGKGSINKRPGAVVLTEKAAAILQGFPETWNFEGRTKKARWSQIGQAMPPPLAEAVARAILERDRHLEGKSS